MNEHPSILLVDDDEDTREMYAWSLEARGFEVAGAGTAAGAFAMAESRRPDVIITDFTLPGEDGFVLAQRVRSAAALRDTPMVLVSGRAFVAGSGERAMEIFDRVLLKPVLPDELIGEIVPLLLDRTAARLQRQLRAVRDRVRRIPHGSGVSRVLEAINELAGPDPQPAAFLADGAAHYIGVNEEACILTGRSRDQLLEMSVWDLTPQIALSDGQRDWAQFVARGTLAGAYRLRTAEGDSVEASFAAVAHVLPGCHLSLLNRLPTALVP
jgi:CheY-like chemotaxis protein